MRQQQKILYETIMSARAGGALKIDAPFLTFGEVLEGVREIVKEIAADYGAVPANTVQTWMKSRLSIQADRPTRNRLYSGLDLIRIASVYYLVHVAKVDFGLAIHMVDFGMDELDRDSRHFAPDVSPLQEFHPAGYIIARPAQTAGEWTIASADDADLLHKHLMRGACATVFNFALVVWFASGIALDRWDAKAAWLMDAMEREIAKRKGKR
jgi:hypothetical protein